MPSLTPRLLLAGVLALAALGPAVALAPPAAAHDQVVSTTPADGASVAAPTAVSVTFSEPVLAVATANRVVVTGPDGPVDGDLSTHGAVVTLTFSSPLAGGRYRVQWRAASGDGHPVSGAFAFTVNGGSATTSAVSAASSASSAAPGSAASPAASAAASPTSTAAGSGTAWEPWLLGALVVAALAATALIVAAKRGRGDDPTEAGAP